MMGKSGKHKRQRVSSSPSSRVDANNARCGRDYTVSVALPGSIIGNAQSCELKSYVAGQIARAITVFRVDEVIVFSEDGKKHSLERSFEGARQSSPDEFLARILQYLETPQYLRKCLFPMHRDLHYAGLLNPLDAPHHLRADDVCEYREGVTLNRPVKEGEGSLVNIGLRKDARISRRLQPNVRVTVRIDKPDKTASSQHKAIKGRAVAPSEPRERKDMYWGYSTRLASGLDDITQNCPFKGGYDLAIGTSEHGNNAQAIDFSLPSFKHLLVVFGGVGGLEVCDGGDKFPFDMYLNTCPAQGSGTIRTEEAILISLSVLRPHILKHHV